ncbi:MAG: MiaB/RimO family radical SAM methylthiotransferase [Phycisphaeraceae bacterium]|nr:MAG: MiaB/RimO family radical SAM methylthiotransferase [Phycisphaeraceae bacterium]
MAGKTVHLETFGCQMNELDSELVRSQLLALGYRFVDSPEGADVVLYNTCSVRDHAEQKVRSRLGEIAKGRGGSEGAGAVVGVLGCMAERDGVKLTQRHPVVDILCGPGELDKLPALLDNAVRTRDALLADGDVTARGGDAPARAAQAKQIALQGNTSRRSSTLSAAGDNLEMLDLSRAISPTDHNGSAYVRITRGCNKFCTYCVVPHTRGAEMHRPPDHIVDECRRLADAGVIEVTLLGQTVNHYRFEHGAAVTLNGITQPQKGRPHKGPQGEACHRPSSSMVGAFGTGSTDRSGQRSVARVTTFADLLKRIHDEVPAIQRLRFVTSYPRDFGDDVLEVIRDSPRICRYLHVPAQTGSDSQLKAMNRGYTVGEYLEFIDRARGSLDQPEIGRPLMIAGDIIVGFSGETEDDFQATLRLLERVRYKNCFIFKYSPRPGTTAYDRLPDDVPEDVKRRRNNEALAVQGRISDEISSAQIGRTLDVFVEGVSARERKKQKRAAQSGVISLTIGGGEPQAADRDAEPEAAGPIQLASRTDGDLLVLFDAPSGSAPDDLIGKIIPVRITSANTVTLFGEITPG